MCLNEATQANQTFVNSIVHLNLVFAYKFSLQMVFAKTKRLLMMNLDQIVNRFHPINCRAASRPGKQGFHVFFLGSLEEGIYQIKKYVVFY